MLSEHQPIPRERLIQQDPEKSLQQQVNEALREGITRIVLEGTFRSTGHPYSLLTLKSDLEIIGQNQARLEGNSRLTHLLYVADGVKVKISGVTFQNGNTQNQDSQLSQENHLGIRQNIFRDVDGAGLTMGEGSEVCLENCVFHGNHSAICGGAISNLGGYLDIKNSVFYENSCGDTGSAIDTLASGSLTVIQGCTFANNEANQLGVGEFGAVTAFPDTYLVVLDSNFRGEKFTAIDYRLNQQGIAHVFIDLETRFNEETFQAVVQNPSRNAGIRKEMLMRVIRLLAKRPHLVKLEGVPSVKKTIQLKHQDLFEQLTQGRDRIRLG